MPTAGEVETVLCGLAPKDLAQSWDNVGLLVGRPEREIRRVLVSLDVTGAAADEARRVGAELIVAHHPVIFHPVKELTSRNLTGRLLLRLAEEGLSVICMHTNLDAARGGVNDALAAALGLEQVEPLGDGEGVARMGLLPGPLGVAGFLAGVKAALHPNGIRYVDGGRPIRRVAVGGGACGEFLYQAVDRGCDAFVTADVKYNQFLDAQALGLTLVDAGHFPTEDVVRPVLAGYLAARLPGLEIVQASGQREAVQYYL